MSNPRKQHVGKNKFEKKDYFKMLNKQQAENPTYEANETSSTNSVIKDETGKSTISEVPLKSYQPEPHFSWKEIIIPVILAILFLFGMSLNREIGVLQERTNNERIERKGIQNTINDLSTSVNNIVIELKVLKRTRNDSK
jgi:hypothetical protein